MSYGRASAEGDAEEAEDELTHAFSIHVSESARKVIVNFDELKPEIQSNGHRRSWHSGQAQTQICRYLFP